MTLVPETLSQLEAEVLKIVTEMRESVAPPASVIMMQISGADDWRTQIPKVQKALDRLESLGLVRREDWGLFDGWRPAAPERPS
jgi:hypothetical protein